MSLSLISSPFKWGWARNRNAFHFLASSALSPGTAANFSIRLLPLSDTISTLRFVVEIDGEQFIFQGTSTDGGPWTFTSLADLVDKIESNYYISKLYTVAHSESSGAYVLAWNAVNVGAHTASVYYTDNNGDTLTDVARVQSGHVRAGSDPTNYPNYSVAVNLEAVVNNCNVLKTLSSGWMFFSPDADGNVEVPLDMLATFLPQPDIPGTADPTALTLLTNYFVKYRISYAEYYGDTPRLQEVSTTPWRYAIGGEVEDYYHRLNLPDWLDFAPTQQLSSNNAPLFRVIGEDTGLTLDIHASQPEFLTVFFFYSGAAMNAEYTLQLTLTTTAHNGTTSTTVTTFPIKNGNFYRLPVGPTALSTQSCAYYTVTLGTSGSDPQFTRTYHVVPDFYSQYLFLLQNKWGALATMAVPSVAAAAVTEGNFVRVRLRQYVSLSDCYQSFTATSSPLRRDEALRLSRALASNYHYCLAGAAWKRIAVEPASVTFRDDEQDMVVVAFTFRFVENQVDNLPTNTARSNSNTDVVTSNLSDDAGNYLSFATRLTPTTNIIHA